MGNPLPEILPGRDGKAEMVGTGSGKCSLFLLLIILLLLVTGCASASKSARHTDAQQHQEAGVIYVIPFASTLVPAAVHETVFNDFVDLLNENRAKAGVPLFEIVKDDPAELDKSWLAGQANLSGELWSYIENSGCCQTELRIRSRIALTEPGRQTPTFEVTLPMDSFFDHDQSTLEVERVKLARDLARKLADRVISSLVSRK